MKEISARENGFFLIFLRVFKLAFQAALYYRLIPRAPFNEYQACGLSIHFYFGPLSTSLALGWYKLAFQAGNA